VSPNDLQTFFSSMMLDIIFLIFLFDLKLLVSENKSAFLAVTHP